jgi:predicted nucleic acid-binding Zn ribbon protein
MDFDEQFYVEHLVFSERKCRSCGKIKDLINDFYLTHKGRSSFQSAYSYECKECTKKRTTNYRNNKKVNANTYKWEYPDW